jgi:hypothetical protein
VLPRKEKEYYRDGDYHRVNGPAIYWDDGDWSWWLYGQCHRYYGPANIRGAWYIHGRYRGGSSFPFWEEFD